jgi:hypothetical protein
MSERSDQHPPPLQRKRYFTYEEIIEREEADGTKSSPTAPAPKWHYAIFYDGRAAKEYKDGAKWEVKFDGQQKKDWEEEIVLNHWRDDWFRCVLPSTERRGEMGC